MPYKYMLLLRLLSLVAAVFAQDPIGSTGCTAPVCVFSNPHLRFGTGTENSVNVWGLFVQPWYFSPVANTWYKLTYSNYPLDTAVGTGTGSLHWSGTTIVNLYGLTPTDSATDYSNFIVDSSDTAKTVGHGKIVARRSFILSGQSIIFQNTFTLGWNESFVKIVSKVINNSTTPLVNMIIWVGTRDDYVGVTDVNTKTRGNLDTGSFVAITANNQSSRAIMITNTNEGVLFYSETSGVMTTYALCCSFSNAYNVNPVTLAPYTVTPTDGSYAAVLPIGNVSSGLSGSITWYYAAGVITSLSAVAQTVAAAQVADAPTPSSTSLPAPSALAMPSVSALAMPSVSALAVPTALAMPTALAAPTALAVPTALAMPTALATRSILVTSTTLPMPTMTATMTSTSGTLPTLSPPPVANPIIVNDNRALINDIIIINAVTAILVSLCTCCIIGCLYVNLYTKRCAYCKRLLVNETIEEHTRRCDVHIRQTMPRGSGMRLRTIAF